MIASNRATTVIVGGGAVGCGVAYSLAEAGMTDVLLLEAAPTLAAATTSQAAGLVGQVRSTVERTQLAMWSAKTFSKLARDASANPGWKQVGSLRVALTDARVAEFERLKATADEAGLEVEFIDLGRARELFPAMTFADVKRVLWCPTDGYLQPYDLTMAYAAHSRRKGIQFQTNTLVEQVIVEGGRVCGVETNLGTVHCERLINAAGAHAYHLARSAGIELPIVPVRHEFFVTIPCDGLHPDLPVVRIPDATLYLRAETNALLCGGWEPAAMSLLPDQFALTSHPPHIEEDWDVLGGFAEQLAPQLPAVTTLGIRSVFKGWPTFTPDGRFIVGESCRIPGFVMAGGCNAHGVSGSAGIGKHVVESIVESKPSAYVRSLSPDRFTETNWDWSSARTQAQRYYETYYAIDQ